MKLAQVPMTSGTYCNLASCYIYVGIYKKAESALKIAEKIMNHRDRTYYNCLISLYGRAGNLAETIRVWKLLKTSLPGINNRSYHNILHALGKLGDLDGMNQCFEEWESVCYNYDVKVLNVVINAYLRNGMVKEAESLREKGIEKGLGLDFRTLDLFTDYYLERNDVGSALKCLEVVDSSEKHCKWKPNKEKVSVFCKYFEKAKAVDGAQKFCQILKKINGPDGEAYESLIRASVAAERKPRSFFFSKE